jgi:hypothetical protein
MHFFVIEAHPKTSNELYGKVDGAFVSCWANNPLRDVAEAEARAFIEQNGWNADELDTAEWVEDDDYPIDKLTREYFEQAKTDGLVVVFHRWDVGAPDE